MAINFPELRLPRGHLGPPSLARRLDAINEAISWPAGPSIGQQIPFSVWDWGSYEVELAKPGKESVWPPPKTNVNDMLPGAFLNNVRVDYTPSFGDGWRVLEQLVATDPVSVELLGCLLFRAGYMLDHQEIGPGLWRYRPPVSVITSIEARSPTVPATAAIQLPIRVFLHLIEALSLNEDVKYFTRGEAAQAGGGYRRIKTGIGRRNNLSTSAHIAAVLLGRQSLSAFAGQLSSRRGVAALNPSQARQLLTCLA